jgi:hypothetical protein
VTLDDIPDSDIERSARLGFNWLWLLGVWRTGEASRQVSLTNANVRAEAEHTLPDLTTDDIVGSPFAVSGYDVKVEWGGQRALSRLRERLHARGLRLLLDFVPNHTGLDHPWLTEHPEFYIQGTPADLVREPGNYIQVRSGRETLVFAHGRDPYFPGWPDTLQLNYRNPALRRALRELLVRLATVCDGLRCDMAMLLEPDVFERTWPKRAPDDDAYAESFWVAAITNVRRTRPDFIFMAEVYWGREWQLQQQGFDYTYDKELYDRLRSGRGHHVREHLLAKQTYQERSARFLENHDEPRAAATFPLAVHRAAAVIALLAPGLRFFHEGQLEGRRVHVSMHLGRRPDEAPDPALQSFYAGLLACLRRPEVHIGTWSLWVCRPAWPGNESYRHMLVSTWTHCQSRLLVAVNYAPTEAQSYTAIDLPELAGQSLVLVDLLSDAQYERQGDGLRRDGLYLAMPAWGYHVFELRTLPAS